MEKQTGKRRWATRAIRGATTVSSNERDAITEGTAEMMAEILRLNLIDTAEIASVIFTVTSDLNAEFPAAGARKLGLNQVPLLCATEIAVPGSQKRCIRCLVHVNTTLTQGEIKHVYLHEARALRPDLT